MLRLFLLFILNGSTVVASVTTKSWKLSHRLLNANDATDQWAARGTIELSLNEDSDEPSIVISNEKLEESFATLVQNDAALYQIKLGDTILTTVPACHLRRSNFRDELQLSLNDQAEILSLSYHPIISPLAPKSCGDYYETPLSGETMFESKVSFETAVPGMVVGKPTKDTKATVKPPPGFKWLPGPKSSGKKAFGSDGSIPVDNPDEPKPPQGPFEFMKRYWYVFLPILIMNLMGGEAPPPAKEGDDAAPATTAEPKRRGKKG